MPHTVRPLADGDARVPEHPERPVGGDRRPGSTRDRVLTVARDLFCANGYERTPLRAVSDSLGVTKAAIYYHFKAKDDLLMAIVGPVLDDIDELVESVGPGFDSPETRREFLGRYIDELVEHAGIVALLLRDQGVADHALGRRFAAQHARLRTLLGAGDDPASVIRTTTALRGLEQAVLEFADAHPGQVRETALNIAVCVLDSG